MIGSLFAGISGLNANATAMTVIGDNIANVNTTAFKSNRASFANILSQSLGNTESDNVGRGVQFWGAKPLWTQGSLENTSSPTDLAVNGKGFFVVEDTDGSIYYTRAGEFTFDREGNLKNPDGLIVQGYSVTNVAADGTITLGSVGDITVPGESTTPPSATSLFSMDINLDADASAGDTYTTILTVYDSLGNDIPVTFTFTNVAAGSWTVAGSIPATAGTGVTIDGGATAAVTFDAAGALTAPAADATVALTLTNGATSPQSITWDLYDAGGTNNGDVTGYASQSATTFQTQDGYYSGALRSISVDIEGVIVGAYSNGQLIPLFQLVLSDFASYEGLSKGGNNLYSESLASGQPIPGPPATGTLGSITPAALEMSNVDLASEFVKMITTQRAFQASARVITTSDEILTELINVKR
jgi:flagellar hook protein FlgE